MTAIKTQSQTKAKKEVRVPLTNRFSRFLSISTLQKRWRKKKRISQIEIAHPKLRTV
jgi:hypothetical protein